MLRTQIYLTQRERQELHTIAEQTGRTQSDLIREAVDHFIEEYRETSRVDRLRMAMGIWKDRDDLPDFRALRRELDRPVPRHS